jgi:hypothetical protein
MIESWVCECCGILRHVGESVDLELTFVGDVAGSTKPDRIDVLPDGNVRLVGSVNGQADDAHAATAGALVQSGNVQVGIDGDAPAARVCCTGQLWETRHGFPAGMTRGRLVYIRWRPALLREIG